jgi:hypothetical protein
MHQGRKSCRSTYQPPFPSFLLLARPPRATSLRLCVGPALQVSQALPRGGAESDFSALKLSNNTFADNIKNFKAYRHKGCQRGCPNPRGLLRVPSTWKIRCERISRRFPSNHDMNRPVRVARTNPEAPDSRPGG